MENNSLEISLFGMSFKATGLVGMVVLTTFLLMAFGMGFIFAGPQLVEIFATRI